MTTVANEKRNTMYNKILKSTNKAEYRPSRHTDLRWVNPDDMVDIIHRLVDNRMWDNIEYYVTLGVISEVPVIRTNLDFGSFIQIDYVNGNYVIKLFINKKNTCYVSITSKKSVMNIMKSIKDNKFFFRWKKALAMEDYDYNGFESVDTFRSVKAALASI